MTIEFHTPHGEISEATINFLKKNLMACYHRDPEISRAEVYFRKNGEPEDKCICEVDLTVYGNSLMVLRSAASFQQAAEEVVKEVNLKVDEWIANQKEPPDQITSTVKV